MVSSINALHHFTVLKCVGIVRTDISSHGACALRDCEVVFSNELAYIL